MNLRYTLPDELMAAMKPLKAQDIVYCVPYDLTPDGQYCAGGWVVVTRDTLLVWQEERVIHRLALGDYDEILCSPQVDSGLLTAKKGEDETLLCRFHMRHMVRQSYLARGATLFCQGQDRTVSSLEKERYCENCGRVLPGTNVCPHCHGRGRTARRFWDLCRPYVLPLALITLFMVALSAITIGQQYVQRYFVDDVLQPARGSLTQVLGFFGVMVALLALSLTLSITRTLWSNKLGTRISRDLRGRVFSKINALSLSFIDGRQAGELMNRVVEDTGTIRRFMEEVFAGMFTQIFTMIGAMAAMFTMDWRLALLTLVFLPAAAILVRVFHRYEMRLWRQQWRYNDKINGRLQDVLSGIRVVKSFGQEEREIERFRRYSERFAAIQRRNERFWATLYPFVTFLLTIGSFFVIYFGGLDVMDGRMTPGQLIQFVAYAGMLYGPLGFITRLPRMLMRLTTSLERIYDILDEESEIAERPQAAPREIVGAVEFSHVTFGYRSYLPVLEDVNFTVKPGEMIGLVGASGAGKSTVINLLMRLYDVDDGQILLDGVDLRDYTKDSLHHQIGVVLQETFLFSGSVYDNIRYAKPEATYEEVIRAAKMANAHEFITKFPDGYDTYVGEHGYTLSGGERQRIAIARAILHDPRLLILDEATSSLDTETEYQIQQALQRLTAERTTFAIAHRLSTLRHADRILVIDRHRVAEMGTHNELMRQKGIYYGLVMAQLDMHRVKE
ncbi:MAG: ABC transporter ATP-binding protein [Acutalibacteraceae bacterium]